MCPVTRDRRKSHSLYFEVHGTGPQKIVFIVGCFTLALCAFWAHFARRLGNSASVWLPQVEHFGKLDKYATLVFDNRGVGLSGSPWGPYSTSEMAEDILCLLDHLQWTQDHNLHVVGVSLGGMIAQEFAYRVPDRVMTLSLVVTRAGGYLWANVPSPSSCLRFARLLWSSIPSRLILRQPTMADPDIPDIRLSLFERMMFPSNWLDSLAENDPDGRTNRQVQREVLHQRMEIAKTQTLAGALGQMAAGLTHYMTPDRLAKVSASVPKVLILSAAEDVIISHTEGEHLKRCMPEADYQCWETAGHGACAQYKDRFNQLLEKVFEQGREAVEGNVNLN